MRKFTLNLSLLLTLILSTDILFAQCDASFTHNANGNTVQFNANTGSTGIWHHWNFGDGNYANNTGSSISHQYVYPGQYAVTHVIFDSVNNCMDSVVQAINVDFVPTCSADFNFSVDTNYAGIYHFYSTSVGDSILHYQWTVDGVVVSNNWFFSDSLSEGGHIVCLEIETAYGCSSSICDTVEVEIPTPCAVTAEIDYQVSSSNHREISFQASPSGLQGGVYYWTFGDGHSANIADPTHSYTQDGNYHVTLYVEDASGCSDSTVTNIHIRHPQVDSCTASFTWSVSGGGPWNLQLTAGSNQTITSQSWHIVSHDSTQVINTQNNNPTVSLNHPGMYSVCLQITTNTGCVRWHCETIEVQQALRNTDVVTSYPNPADDKVRFAVELDEQQVVSITVVDLSGTRLYYRQILGNQGLNNFEIPVQHFKRGQYFIDIQYGTTRKRSIFQKL